MGLAAAVGARGARGGLVEARGEVGGEGGARSRAAGAAAARQQRRPSAARGRGGADAKGEPRLGGDAALLASAGGAPDVGLSPPPRLDDAETASTIDRRRAARNEVASASTVAERLLLRAAVARDVDRDLAQRHGC